MFQSFQSKNLNCDKYVNETDSIIVAKLSGLQEVRVKLKLDPSAVGPKVSFLKEMLAIFEYECYMFEVMDKLLIKNNSNQERHQAIW